MSASRIEIRTLDDAEAAIALGTAAGLEYTEGDTEGLVARWGACDGGRLVGTVALRRWRGMAIVSWMAVDEGYRGKGIGRLLLRTLEEEAVALGARRLWTTARAPGFYWANGFEPVRSGEQVRLLLGPCLHCEQFGDSCHPVAAVKVLGDHGQEERHHDAIERFLRDDPIDETRSPIDGLVEVGIGGHFLARGSTRQMLRAGELWRPSLWRREPFNHYAGTPLFKDAWGRAQQLIAGDDVSPLSDDVRTHVRRLIDDYLVAGD